MALLVHKYGGTSVGTPARIRAVAERLAALRAEGNDLVVVVSAMGDTTDELLALAAAITPTPARRELDMLLTAGERISMALLSMALNAAGCPAISFTGSQSGIITDSGHGGARILEIRPVRIREELNRGRVVIVAGFQGVSLEREVTTLGRGGSDTSAVALAVAFGAAECAIYTDVDGVFTGDPRHVPEARHIDRIAFDTMLEFSSRGAGVINSRAVELARKFGMPLVILNSLREHPGTRVEGEVAVEGNRIAGVTGSDGIVLVRLQSPDGWPAASVVLEQVAACGLEAGTLALDEDPQGVLLMSFILPKSSRLAAELDALRQRLPAGIELSPDERFAAVSIVGSGVLKAPAVAARAVAALQKAGITASACRAATLSMTFLVPSEELQNAVRVLHSEFITAA